MPADVRLSRNDVKRALLQLEILIPSLDRLGSEFADEPSKYQSALASFVEDWNVFGRLTEMRKILSAAFEDDELEREFSDVPSWSPIDPKPPPGA